MIQSTSQSNSCAAITLPKVLVTSMIPWPIYRLDTLAHTHPHSLRYGVQSTYDTFMKNICSSNIFDMPAVSKPPVLNPLSFHQNMIHYPKHIWQIVFSGGSRVRRERTDERDVCWREEERQRGGFALSSVWFGSRWRANVLGVRKENTINCSLCYSFIMQDYHSRSIHHIERVVCSFHTCTAIWIYAGLKKNARRYTKCWGTECQPKAINPLAGWERVQMGLCLCVLWCLMFRYEACSNQSPHVC